MNETRRVFTGRAADDDRTHLVDATEFALLDPSPFRTRCGRAVLEVYNADRPVTCSDCSGAAGDVES
jgi:hypothetical protein